ncbi:hypothetical protein SAMN05192552_103520 [Natrinema hispanicum]|uniref:DUF7511 domain-containing protein n=1 Tax=Natrinema hispanicum TaxID=392421 RepID=A0A1G6WA25_9EURY|nr:hypothetical protein SAMN05192552_103520 [Natrinema hispanicum]
MNEPKSPTTEAASDPRKQPRSTLFAFVQCRDTLEICTLFPPTVVTPHRTDAWIRATGDAFRSLEEWQ